MPRRTAPLRALVAHKQTMLPLRPMLPPATQRWTAAGLLADWLLTRQSPNTREAYRCDMQSLASFLDATPEQAAQSLLQGRAAAEQTLEHFDRWMRDTRGLAPYSRARRIWALQSFVKHANRREVVSYQVGIKTPKLVTRRDTRGPAYEKLDLLLLQLACDDDPRAIRDAALLGLMYVCGLRQGEVLTMRMRDCDVDERRLMIVAKGRLALVPKRSLDGKLLDPMAHEPDREPLEGVPKSVWKLLGRWQAWLRKQRPDVRRDSPLWWAFVGGGITPYARMSDEGLGRIVRRRLKRARIKACTLHGLRHSAITKALDLSGGNLRLVQGFARHADLRQLARYDDARRGLFAEGAKLVAGGGLE
jgi:integrase/recombinase XerC